MSLIRYTIEGRAFPGFDTGDYVRFTAHEDVVATLTRERDEARAALALAYPRALQAAASVLLTQPSESEWLDEYLRDLAAQMRALTPEDIERGCGSEPGYRDMAEWAREQAAAAERD